MDLLAKGNAGDQRRFLAPVEEGIAAATSARRARILKHIALGISTEFSGGKW